MKLEELYNLVSGSAGTVYTGVNTNGWTAPTQDLMVGFYLK